MQRLLLIVIPLLLIVGCSKPKELPSLGDKIFNGDIDDIHRVIISQNNNKLMEFINNGENWNVTNESKDYWKTTKQSQSMIIEQFMSSFLDSLSNWQLINLITDKEEKWERFGVDNFAGRNVIGIDKTDKELFHYIISTKKSPAKRNYIRLAVPLSQDIEQLSNVFTLHYVKPDKSIDICRCLTEPGNSKYMQENGDACREAISKEIGVDNWENVNFSQNAELSARFDALVTKCQ